MPVPSVATSISSHPSSSYVFSPSLSHLTEPRMVTPTEGLVSQQILSLPPSLAIVDMATLNSLDIHSCRNTCLDCRNVQSLPSQESPSLTVDPVAPASNLITSKNNEYGENILGDQEKFKSSPLAELYPRTSDCNCINDVDIKQTSNSSSTSAMKAPECRFLGMFGKGNEIEEPLTCADPLPRSLKKFDEVGYKINGKVESGCIDVSKISDATREIDDKSSEVESPSIQSNIFHENKSKSFLSVKSAQDLHSGIEGNLCEEISSVPIQRDNVNEFYFDKAISSGNSRYISSDLWSPVKNSSQPHPYVEGEIESSDMSCEQSLQSPNIVDLSSCCLLETSDPTESGALLCAARQFSNLTLQVSTSASDSLVRSLNSSCHPDDRALSIYNHLINNGKTQELTMKSSLIMSPSLHCINTDLIAEIIAPELKSYDYALPKNGVVSSDCWGYGSKKRKFEKPLMLILAEVPSASDHITFDLSEILPECSNKNLVFEKKAVFDVKSSFLHSIKVTAAENYSFDSKDGSLAFNKNLATDQIFVKVNPASESLKQFTLWDKFFPVSEIASSIEETLNSCMSCTIIRLDEQSFIQESFLKGGKPDSKPMYLGLLVPSNFLHLLNISAYPKGSLSISLSSSRPNQQYSTSTSVDVQFNGNNEDSVPVIPLGIYSPKGSSDLDSKWLSSLTNYSHKDVQNLEDIFLTWRDGREGRTNSDVHSMKQFDLTDILLTKSSNYNHISETGYLNKEAKEQNVDSNIFSSEIQILSKELGKLKSSMPLNCFAERDEKFGEGISNSNEIFHLCNELHHHQPSTKKEEQMKTETQDKDIMIHSKQASNLTYKNEPPTSPKEGVSSNDFIDHKCRKPSITPQTPNQANIYGTPSCRDSKHKINEQDSHLTNDLKFSSDNGVCGQKNCHMSVVRDDFSLLRLKNDFKNNKSFSDLQKRTNKDQVGLDILDTNYYSLKKKIQAKRLEGFCRPFKINKASKNKPGIEFKKAKKNPDDEYIKIREDLNGKLDLSSKPVASSWKLNHYGNACLSSIKNILASTVFESNKKSLKGDLIGMDERNLRGDHCTNYQTDGTLIIQQKSKYDRFSSHESGRQLSKLKSSDRKFNRNFSLSSSGSTKRSKLTILIFCLAVTSLLISLHALSTDSSLYIKPTFFLVQEDEMASSFTSENSYLEKPHYPDQRKWAEHAGTDEPVHQVIESKEEVGSVNEAEGMGNGVRYVKNKATSMWTHVDNDVNSKNDVIVKGSSGSGSRITPGNDKMAENEQLLSLSKIPSSDLVLNRGMKQIPSISKGTSNLFNLVNLSVPKSNSSALADGRNGDVPSLSPHDENVLSWIKSKYKGQNENDEKNKIDSSAKESETTFTEMNGFIPDPGENFYQSYQPNNRKIISNMDNQTKSSLLSNDGTINSQNEFDLNLAFIEKNELNAAYGIDSATTGADGNIEDYVGEEDLGIMATSGNRIKFPKATRRLPQALIIGVRKGGTRALLEMLHLHPLVQKAAGEAHFFDRDENYAKGLQWYRRRMPPSLKGQITVEKSPSYFVTPEVPERVRAMNASIRLLLIVREPVTRAISDFAQLRSHSAATKANATTRTKLDGGGEDDYGKKQATRSLSSFESLAILPDGRVDMSWRPISVSLYHRHIAAWLEAFPRDQILIVDGDQLASNPAPVLASVEKFLKLRPALTPTHFYFNATKGFYCLRSLPPGQQVDGMAMLPSSVNNSPSLPEGKCLRESKGRRHPHVDPSVVHKLRRFFAEHNRRFYEMVGEDFGWPEE